MIINSKKAGGSPRLQAKTVTANGTVTPDSGYDGLSSVTVAIPAPQVNSKVFEITLANDVTSAEYYRLIATDADLKAHRSESTMQVAVMPKFTVSGQALTSLLGANFAMGAGKRIVNRTSSSGQPTSPAFSGDDLTQSKSTSYMGHLKIDTDGNLYVMGNATYKLQAGAYRIIASW